MPFVKGEDGIGKGTKASRKGNTKVLSEAVSSAPQFGELVGDEGAGRKAP